jgi:hypothetical protein
MDRNPYSPPETAVHDPIDRHPARPRPARIALAVRLLWIEFAVSVIQAVCDWAISRDPLFREIIVVVSCVTLPLEAWVIQQIWRGRNWARWVMVAAVILSVLMWWDDLGGTSDDSRVSAILGAVELGLDAVALYLLFSKSGRDWFAPPESSSG